MKYLLVLLVAVVLFSCSGTKKVLENTPKESTKESAKVATETEVVSIPEVIETPPKVEEIKDVIKVDEPAKVIETPEVVETKEPVITTNPEAFNHDSFNEILNNHVTDAGNVNYKGIKANRKKLTNYIVSLGDNMPSNTWSKEDKMAYWINAYNAMTIDLILRNYPLQSIKDIKDPWDQRLWKLGSKWYNLNEIEHQILRKMDEPRIHFGIVCASFSCPKLQNEAFTATNLETKLTAATTEFLADNNRNNISQNNLKLSKIFKWFAKDFKQNGTIIDFINLYSEVQISESTKNTYKDYNWDLND